MRGRPADPRRLLAITTRAVLVEHHEPLSTLTTFRKPKDIAIMAKQHEQEHRVAGPDDRRQPDGAGENVPAVTTDKTAETMTISDIRELFERSPDANVVRDCVRAIGSGVGGVFASEMKDYQQNSAIERLVVAHNAGPAPRIVTKHRDFTIKSIEHHQPFHIDGTFIWSGYNVCSDDGWINVMPGACWFMTLAEAIRGIDCLIEAGGSPHSPYQKDSDVGQRFWKLMEKYRKVAP